MAHPIGLIVFPFLVGAIAIAQVSAHDVAAPVPVSVDGTAGKAIPILLQTQDYEGPYDPIDPQGVQAATRRGLAIAGKNSLDVASSYIPPGAFEMLLRDLKKVFIREAKRFGLHHPVESAELLGIATKVTAFVKTAAHKVQVEAKKEQISHTHH